MMKEKISNLHVHVLSEDGKWQYLPLEDSPYYQYLISLNHSIHDRYTYILKMHDRPVLSYKEFLTIFRDIRYVGYDKYKKWWVNNYEYKLLRDGQHRASIIYYLYGDIDVSFEPTGYKDRHWVTPLLEKGYYK